MSLSADESQLLELSELQDQGLSRPIMRALPELYEILVLVEHLKGLAKVRVLANVRHNNECFPLIAVCFGPADPELPILALFGGVHGLERIGTRVVISYLRTVMEMVRWDRVTQEMLKTTRLLMVPLVNPVGMYLKRRANGQGVDLMRNAPVQAEGLASWHLFGGHRLTPNIPWYRGKQNDPMEVETQAICDFVRQEVFPAKIAVSVDVHSGFGRVDRLWFPYAKTQRPLPAIPETVALKHLLDKTYPNHVYCMEPQCRHYLAHGDLWDYLYDEYRVRSPEGCFIPFTLELGSWIWVQKNWSQVFSILGMFNPRLPHRVRRTLRRHLILFDFLMRAVRSPEPWLHLTSTERERCYKQGMKLWYRQS
jgi:hypothetical protein